MNRTKNLAALAALVLLCWSCGKDVIIDVDSLPAGNAQGSAAAGTFLYNEVVTESSCPATASGVALPDVGVSWGTTVTVAQSEGYYSMYFAPSGGRNPTPDSTHPWDGGIYWHGNFRIGGTYFFPDGSTSNVTFINLVDGRYTVGVDQFEGWTTVRVQAADGTDCEIKVDFTGTRTGP
jgi:hypothetical protein